MSEMLFTFVEGSERGEASPSSLYGQTGEVQQVTAADLEAYFNDPERTNRLPEVFGTFENYLAYMTERQQMIDAGTYDTGNWSESTGRTADEEFMLDADNDVWTPETSDANYEAQQQQGIMSNQQGAYENWINSDANQALLQKYGVNPTVYSDSGDKFKWNGSSYVKVENVEEELGQYVKAGMIAAMGMYAGAGFEQALGVAGGAAGGAGGAGGYAGVLQAAAGNALGTAIAQGVVNGSVDASSVVQAGLMGGLGELASMAADGALAASSDLGAAADNLAWDLADALGTDVDTVYEMATGIASGALQGNDIEDIVLGAVGTYTTDQLMNYIDNNFADQFGDIEVGNWFDEDTTSIDVRAFEPFVETAVGGVLGDDVNAEDLMSAIWESGTYDSDNAFDQGGTFAYADPTRGELGDLMDDLGGWDLPDFGLPSIDLPEFDLPDVNLPDVDLPEIDVDLPEIDVDLPEVDVDLPEVNIDTPDIDIDGPDIDGPDIDIDSPDIDFPSLAMGAGMMGGGAAAFDAFNSGIDSYVGARPLRTPAAQATDPTAPLDDLIARNLGGRLFGGVA